MEGNEQASPGAATLPRIKQILIKSNIGSYRSKLAWRELAK
jgi:hypothetical protein